MIILGLDPGLADTGWGIINRQSNCHTHVAHGFIHTESKMEPGERLNCIYEGILQVVETYKPQAAGIESLFFAKNKSSGIPVAQARGVLLLLLNRYNISVTELTPPQIKQTITGSGTAEKIQVQHMIKILLGLKDIPKPDHAADALAAAVTCSILETFNTKINLKAFL